MTIRDKIALCSGKDFWHTKTYENIPVLTMSDGPHGLRKQVEAADMLGINRSVPATCFPTAVTTACSWDDTLLNEVGRAIAKEAAANGVGLLLGPGANIKRNPLCGRNFEYFSEDPYLTGKLAAGYIRGVEGTGVSSSLKHFAMNNQEYKRHSSDSIVDERTMREIYLAGFEMAVKEGKPSTVMCSYNKINGIHASDNKWLLTDVLRDEWGFDGLVVTDWGAMGNRIEGFKAGCDLNMPGGAAYMESEVERAIAKGELDRKYVDVSCERIRKLALRGKEAVSNAETVVMEDHFELARKAAVEGAVLLKNVDDLLPVNKDDVVFIGMMAKNMRYQGAGSSHINPWKLISPLDVCPNIPFEPGCDENGDTNEELLSAAVEKAKEAKTAIVFAGLTDSYESEGFDRDNMRMPEGHIRMIEEVAKANPNTVVVLLCGSVVEMPWEDKVKSILYMGLPGEAGGEAICDLIFGKEVPSGKLAETWPYKYEDVISSTYYAGNVKDAHYREGLYVGYRYYSSAHVPVRYPFGYGLSYTHFSYSNIGIDGNTVFCTVTNTGKLKGKEVVQLYICPPTSEVYRPVIELKGFTKIELNPGESKVVSFELNDRSFAIWNDGWVIPRGVYTICIGSNSCDLSLSIKVEKGDFTSSTSLVPEWYYSLDGVPSHEDFELLVGHKVIGKPLVKGSFTMENSVMEMKDYSLVMKIMYSILEMFIAREFGGKKDYSNSAFKMMMVSASDCSLSGMRICSGVKNHVFEGMLMMANGHYLSGLIEMLKK